MLVLIMDDIYWTLVGVAARGAGVSSAHSYPVLLQPSLEDSERLREQMQLAQYGKQSILLGLPLSYCHFDRIQLPSSLPPQHIKAYCQIKIAKALKVAPNQCLLDYVSYGKDTVYAVACSEVLLDSVKQLFTDTALCLRVVDINAYGLLTAHYAEQKLLQSDELILKQDKCFYKIILEHGMIKHWQQVSEKTQRQLRDRDIITMDNEKIAMGLVQRYMRKKQCKNLFQA